MPELAGLAPFGLLDLLVLLEEGQQLRGAVERQLLPSLALPKDQAAAVTLRAPVGMTDAVLTARPLRARVSRLRAPFPAVRLVAMNRTLLLAGLPMPPLAADVRVATAVLPGPPLDLKPGFYLPGFEVDVRPAQPESLALVNAERQSDRPASTIAAMPDNTEDFSNLLPRQHVGFCLFGGRRFHEHGYVTADPAATHRDAQSTRQNPMDLQHAACRKTLAQHLGVSVLQVLGLKASALRAAAGRPLRHALRACGVGAGPSGRADRAAYRVKVAVPGPQRCHQVRRCTKMRQWSATALTPPAGALRLRDAVTMGNRCCGWLRWKPGHPACHRPRTSRADQASGAKVVRPVGRSTFTPEACPAPRRVGRRQTG